MNYFTIPAKTIQCKFKIWDVVYGNNDEKVYRATITNMNIHNDKTIYIEATEAPTKSGSIKHYAPESCFSKTSYKHQRVVAKRMLKRMNYHLMGYNKASEQRKAALGFK